MYNVQIGQAVRLIIGGPMMLLQSIEGNYGFCVWWDKNFTLQRTSFPLASLFPVLEVSVIPAPDSGV